MRRRLVWIQGAKMQFPPAAFLANALDQSYWWNYKIFRKTPLTTAAPEASTAIALNLIQDGIEALPPLIAQFRPNNEWIVFGEGDDDPNSGGGFSLYYARNASGYTMTVDYNEIAAAIGGVASLYPWELANTGFRGPWDSDWGIADFRFNRNPGDPLLWGSAILDETGLVDIQVTATTNLNDLPNHWVFPDRSVTVPAFDRLGRLAYCAIDRSKIVWRDPYFVWRIAYADGTTFPLSIADPKLSGETVAQVMGGWTAAWDGTTEYIYIPDSGPSLPSGWKGRRLRITGGEIWLDYEVEIGWPNDPEDYHLTGDLWMDLY